MKNKKLTCLVMTAILTFGSSTMVFADTLSTKTIGDQMSNFLQGAKQSMLDSYQGNKNKQAIEDKMKEAENSYQSGMDSLKNSGYGKQTNLETPTFSKDETPQGSGKSATDVYKEQIGDPNVKLNPKTTIPSDDYFQSELDSAKGGLAALELRKQLANSMLQNAIGTPLVNPYSNDIDGQLSKFKDNASKDNAGWIGSVTKPGNWGSVKIDPSKFGTTGGLFSQMAAIAAQGGSLTIGPNLFNPTYSAPNINKGIENKAASDRESSYKAITSSNRLM